jgi:hypothetical protein
LKGYLNIHLRGLIIGFRKNLCEGDFIASDKVSSRQLSDESNSLQRGIDMSTVKFCEIQP